MQTTRSQRGFTLAEVLVVLAVSTVILMICYELVESAMRTSLYVESHNQLAQLAQRPLNFMQAAAYQSKNVFVGDAVGNAYLAQFVASLPAAQSIAPDYKLPIVDPSNLIAPDSGTGANRFTGNVLLIARQLPPLLIDFDHDNNAGTPNIKFPVDRYRFELYYLSRNTTRNFSTSNYFLDLIQARTIDFVDYFQLNPLIGQGSPFSPAQKQQLATQIGAQMAVAGVTRAWDPTPNIAVNNAFYTMNTGGPACPASPCYGTMTAVGANPPLPLYAAKSMEPEFGSGSISGKMIYTVGFKPTSTTSFPVRDAIPKYAVYDNTIPNFPSGFEVKTVGSGAVRKTMMRLVLITNYGVTKMDSQEGFVISSF